MDDDDATTNVDFSNAAVYVAGVQALCGVLSSAAMSVLACWALPAQAVSAVRTLTLASIVGAVCVYKPIRLAKVAGLSLVFDALRPAVPLYLTCLVLEQLVHTCSVETSATPSWRRVVFGISSLAMLGAGFARARNPLDSTDLPFLVCVGALLVVALLPPPAVALAGPLCEAPTLFSAAERLIRAASFGSVFCTFVFCSMSPTARNGGDSLVTVIRAFTSSVWTLASPAALLFLSVPQCAMAVWSRLRVEKEQQKYATLPTSSPPPEPKDRPPSPAISPTPSENPTIRGGGGVLAAGMGFGPLKLRDVSQGPSRADMERIAAQISG